LEELGVSPAGFFPLRTWDSRIGVLGFKSLCCCFCIFLKVNHRPPLNPNPYLLPMQTGINFSVKNKPCHSIFKTPSRSMGTEIDGLFFRCLGIINNRMTATKDRTDLAIIQPIY
jgi:hypothetical protein